MGFNMFLRNRFVKKLDRKRRHNALAAAVRSRLEWLEDRTLLSVLTVTQENQLAGTPESTWDISGVGDSTLQGFATNMSVNVGQTEQFKITNTGSGTYHLEIYR